MSVFNVGRTVLFCVFSIFLQHVLQFFMDKLMSTTSEEISEVLKLTFDNIPFTVLTMPEALHRVVVVIHEVMHRMVVVMDKLLKALHDW